MIKTYCLTVVSRVLLPLLVGLGVSASPGQESGNLQDRSSQSSRRPQADRRLTEQEATEILTLSDSLIDSRTHWIDRKRAARRLGLDLGHKHCIPALLAVLRDQKDTFRVRQGCVLALSWIADRRVVDFLIEALLDPERNVAIQAHVQLQKLTGQPFQLDEYDPDPKSEMRKRHYQQWRQWWELHRDEANIKWNDALIL